MHITNNGALNKARKGGIPHSVRNNQNFTFGKKSDIDLVNYEKSSEAKTGEPPEKYTT